MKQTIFDARRHPLRWGLPLLALFVWHVTDTLAHLGAQYLFFVCYTANLFLCLGIFCRRGLWIGIGFGWLLIAFPLWLYDAILTANWAPSCTLFHLVGPIVGGVAIRSYRLPRHTWLAAIALAAVLHLLARLCTDPVLNINSAFRIYHGWEWLYPDYASFYLTSLLGFSAWFMLFTRVHNRYFWTGDTAGLTSGEDRS